MIPYNLRLWLSLKIIKVPYLSIVIKKVPFELTNLLKNWKCNTHNFLSSLALLTIVFKWISICKICKKGKRYFLFAYFWVEWRNTYTFNEKNWGLCTFIIFLTLNVFYWSYYTLKFIFSSHAMWFFIDFLISITIL